MRDPDLIIRGSGTPYLLRWWLTPWRSYRDADPGTLNRLQLWIRDHIPVLYLHCILRSDDDRALHDHPSWNLSIVLRGRYREIQPEHPGQPTWADFEPGGQRSKVRRPGAIVGRRADAAHRLEVVDGPIWTLFVMGPKRREWGFRCQHGWRHWREFAEPTDSGRIGRGCE